MRTSILLLVVACRASAPPSADDATHVAIDRRTVPLDQLPRWVGGLPMRGLASAKIDLSAPVRDGKTLYSQARGTFRLSCDEACRLGDDVARLELPGLSLDVGHLDIASLAIAGTVEDGHAKLTQWQLISPDLQLAVDLDIHLADDLVASTIDGCVRFAPDPGLATRRPKTWAVLQTTGASRDRADMFSIRISGTLGAPKRTAQACDAPALTMN